MNEKQSEDLDSLLRQWKSPAPPPWLATRVLAEVRRAPDPGSSPVYRMLRRVLLPSMSFVLLAGIVWFLTVHSIPSVEMEQTSMATLESALDVFAHYSDEVEPWSTWEAF
ncbi:MAG: hypothetical protein ACFCUX_10175 [Candidatus Methylacidiphilales bacterium]